MKSAWPPDPEPTGSLQPPRRRPPTAVGVATPPPPRDRSQLPSYYYRLRRRRRIANAIVGTTMAASAVGLASVGGIWLGLASAALGVSAGALIFRAIRVGQSSWTEIELHAVPLRWLEKLRRRRAA